VRGYTADGAVVGEPTSLDFVPGHGGVMWFEITVPGVSAHAGYRTRGVNAIEKAMVVYWALRDLETRRNAGRKNRAVSARRHSGADFDWGAGVRPLPGPCPDSAKMRGRIGVTSARRWRNARADLLSAIETASQQRPIPERSTGRPSNFLAQAFASSVLPLEHPFSQLAQGVLDQIVPAHRMWAKTTRH